ncbi:immunoglobulin-like domain-containing protein [Enterococcus sp. AZ196]|uniref:immunoglobulin-like domain-containing protein n=1 Tax=Enterococcus sp. AZ196 TaxID=2774659 RepID=UPI003D2A7481
MKRRKYLATFTIASVLLPAFLATQTGTAAENETNLHEQTQATEAPVAPAAPVVEAPVSPPEVSTPVAPDPVATPAPEVSTPSNTAPTAETPQASTQVPAQPAPAAPQQENAVQEKPAEVKPLDVNPFPPNVPSDSKPAINIIPVQSIPKGTAFDPMAGVSATDQTDGDITSKVTYTGTVDVNVVGSYLLTYSVTNSKGQTATQSANIRVVDTNVGMYSIELADFSLPKGADYVQAIRDRIVVKDADGTVLPIGPLNILVSGHHSTDKVGTIAVEVAVLSSYNTVTKKIVNITIVDNSAVRIDAKDVTLNVGDTFDPYSYAKGYETDVNGTETELGQAADASSVGIFVLSDNTDTSKAGTYQVTYQAKSAAGTVVTKTINVNVVSDISDRLPNIIVEDKVMYVGDKLTKEMILAWATTENPDDFITGFKVVNGKIKVKFVGSTLVEPGVHEIMFSAITNEGKTAEKSMTLTVKEREIPAEDDGSEANKNEPTQTIDSAGDVNSEKTSPKVTSKLTTVKTEQKGSVKTASTLPKTGESSSNVFLTLIGLIMSAGVGAFLFKKKITEKNIKN